MELEEPEVPEEEQPELQLLVGEQELLKEHEKWLEEQKDLQELKE